MKLVLVNTDPKNREPPIGLAYLASYIRTYSDVKNIAIIDEKNPLKAIEKEKPDIIGMGSYSYNFNYVNDLAKEIKDNTDIPIIIGGSHISALPHSLTSSNFDIGVMGEGEQTLLELLQSYEKCGEFKQENLKTISGLVFHNNDGIKVTTTRPLIEPIDKIPFPARDLLDMGFYLTLRKGSFSKLGIYSQMITSRGCPYKCIFCAPTNFWRKPRFHSPTYVVDEIKLLKEKYKVDGILIWDDLFIADKERLKEIVRILKYEKLSNEIEFSVFGRANLMNEEICKLLKEMNVTSIDFGLESGSDRILSYLKKGTVTVENNRNALRLSKENGMRTLGTFIIGSPDETEEDLKQSLELLNSKDLDEAYVFQLSPLPGTEFWEYAKREGVVTDDLNFDFSKIITVRGSSKPNFIFTKNINRETFEAWTHIFQNAMDEKNRKIRFFSMKFRNLSCLFSYRFLTKIVKNKKEVLIYFKKLFK